MNRLELLEIDQENERLRGENARLTEQLNYRKIRLETSGSIAEAALALNHVFMWHTHGGSSI